MNSLLPEQAQTTRAPQPDRGKTPIAGKLPIETVAYQGFIRGLRDFWRNDAYRGTVTAAGEHIKAEPTALERALEHAAAYRLYAWLERHSQQLKYYGRWGIMPHVAANREGTLARLAQARAIHPERLQTVSDFQIPDYVSGVDTHQHAGGLWQDPCDGAAYEVATTGFSFSLLDPDAPMRIYAQACRQLIDRQGIEAAQVVDIGCTTGGSTRALRAAFPHARLTGCDVSAPPLMVAHLRAVQDGAEVYWRQASAEHLPFEDASVDLVASHWLLHEMPPRAIRRFLREARRVLRPGGVFVAQDMYLTPGGNIGKWLAAGYAARNNEPFAYTLMQLDMAQELRDAGLAPEPMALSFPEPSAAVAAGALPPARTHYVTIIAATSPRAGESA